MRLVKLCREFALPVIADGRGSSREAQVAARHGGICTTRGPDTSVMRYGTMAEAVLNLTVVTPKGQLIRKARRVRKSAAGYDLTHLYIGSGGGRKCDLGIGLGKQKYLHAAHGEALEIMRRITQALAPDGICVPRRVSQDPQRRAVTSSLPCGWGIERNASVAW